MGIVRFALRLPHTFYVLAVFIVFMGGIAIRSMPTDVFPEINIPVVTVIWQAVYFGMGVLLVLAGALGVGGWGAYQERNAA